MPREVKEYEVVEEFDGMVAKLIELNDEKFGHIDPLVVKMVAITNKEPAGKPFVIKPVPNPTAMFCPDVRFIVVVNQGEWDSWSEDTRALVIFDALESLEPDEKEPKIRPFDLVDHSSMIRTFGVDYLENPEIKGLMSSPVEWK